jgi:prepilin-type processing-associated H-X9-DG protein
MLKQIGISFLVWGTDHDGLYPMAVSTSQGGTLEYVAAGDVFPHFQVMSDAMGDSTKVLICPQDIRPYAKDFGLGLSNTNISYFLGVDARRDKPQMFLAGDRNITNGMPRRNGFLKLSANHNAGWTQDLHNGQGNVLLADASVQVWNTLGLRAAIQNTGDATNRLAMP